MNKLIKIEIANPNALRINFVMTRSCTYECRYCPDDLHYGTHRDINLNDLKLFLSRFTDRNTAVQLTGGECTTHPQFEEVIKLIKDFNYNVLVDSNSVRTLRFYDEVKHLVDNWCITLHPSQHKLDLEKLKLLSQHSFLVIYVMMDPNYWEISLDWFDQISKLKDLKVTPIRVMNNWGGANFHANYSDEQLEYLSKAESKWLFTVERETELRKTHMWLADTESIATDTTGNRVTLDPFKMIRTGTNNFYGWQCKAGNESICIFDDGKAIWANCGIKKFNHYLELTPEIMAEPLKCNFLACSCATDIRASKSKN